MFDLGIVETLLRFRFAQATKCRQKSISMSLIFVKEGLRKLKTQGSILPSTSALARRMLEPIEMFPGIIIVELGAGTGIFTREIISRLPERSRLIVFENNNVLASRLKKDLHLNIQHGNVIMIEDDAANLLHHLKGLNIPKINYVISGLPIGNFNHAKRQSIFDAINNAIDNDGIYVQFQYLLASWLHISKIFDAKIIGFELCNIPPAFVYKCQKKYKG